jgi:hypothetical protein
MISLKVSNFRRLIAIIFFSLTAFSCFASGLKGVKEVSIVIEKLDEHARKCGITEAQVDAALRLPISNSRLRVTNSVSTSYVYARVTALEVRNSCAVHAKFEFKRYLTVVNDVGTFWDKGGLVYWDKNDVLNKISNDLELYTKEFIATWLKENLD